jgi:hypothetical protein
MLPASTSAIITLSVVLGGIGTRIVPQQLHEQGCEVVVIESDPK